MSTRRKLTALGIVALTLGSALTACSSDEGTPTANSGECGSGEPIVVNLSYSTQPATLDPNYETIIDFAQISRNMFDGLFRLNDKLEIEPGLAKEYKQVDDVTYDIPLREDVKWQDGSAFTANDVVSTFNRIASDEDLASKQKGYVSNVASVTATNDHEVQFKLKQADATFIKSLATLIYITPADIIEQDGNAAFGKTPVGTGPFKLKSWTQGDRITLEANCDYFGEKPIPSEVSFQINAEPATAVSALQSGEVDIASKLPADLTKTLEGNPDINLQTIDGIEAYWLTINSIAGGPFSDQRVRQALNYGVDKATITEQLYSGNATELGQIYAGSIFGSSKDVTPYPFDPEKSKQLLAEAGYQPGDVQLDLVLDRDDWRPTWLAIAANLSDAGFNVKTTFDPNFFTDKIVTGDMAANQIYFMSNNNILLDADYALGLHLDCARRCLYFKDDAVDKAIADARGIADQDERQAAYDTLNARLKEIAPEVFLYNAKVTYGINSRINWTPRPDQAIYLAQAVKTS